MFAIFQQNPSLDTFQTMLKTKSGRWYNACLRITQDAGMAEDAVQEALLKAWRQRDEFRGDAELDTWIHRIALNAAIDAQRRQRPVSVDDDALADHPAHESQSPEARYTTRALANDLAGAMALLTTMERECFVLKHMEGWRLDEIAVAQKTNINNTKQALFRAVRKLRVALTDWRGEA
jgi:RNA polymerase sigma-70 factor, ECF subfamily